MPKGIVYYVKGRYFIIILDGPIPAIYKKPLFGIITNTLHYCIIDINRVN